MAPALCTALLGLVIASSSTAQADPQAWQNIPAAGPEIVAPPAPGERLTETSELPLPYTAWQGSSLEPPSSTPAPDAPLPLARPRQLPRRPFEVTAALAAFLPSCGAGSLDDSGCSTVAPGSGVDFALLYRVGPFFAVGAEAALSGFSRQGAGTLSGAGGGARFFGVVGRVYFADDGAWDPYLALALGTGTLSLRGESGSRVSSSGFGGRVAGGIDYLLGSRFRLGPTASFAHWLAWGEQSCQGNVCRDQPASYGRLLGFATLGFRLTAAFGDVL
jgi:hypothetical protein